jgi:hypothetical protein
MVSSILSNGALLLGIASRVVDKVGSTMVRDARNPLLKSFDLILEIVDYCR